MNEPLKVYVIDDGERHWYAAPSAADALDQLLGSYGEADPEWKFDISELPNNRELTIINDDGSKTVKTCAAWAKEIGRGCNWINGVLTMKKFKAKQKPLPGVKYDILEEGWVNLGIPYGSVYDRKTFDELDSFSKRDLAKPGTLIQLANGSYHLIGHINEVRGVCDDCVSFDKDEVVIRYRRLIEFK